MRRFPRSAACGTCDARSTNSSVGISTRYTRQASHPEIWDVSPTISPSISSKDSSELTIRLTRCKTEISSGSSRSLFQSPSYFEPKTAKPRGPIKTFYEVNHLWYGWPVDLQPIVAFVVRSAYNSSSGRTSEGGTIRVNSFQLAVAVGLTSVAVLAAPDPSNSHFQQGRSSDSREELSELSSSRRSGSDVTVELQRRPALGEGDQGRGGFPEDAAMACRSELRPFRE